jgi:hypothetical protein
LFAFNSILIKDAGSVLSSAVLEPAAAEVAAGELYGTMIVGTLGATVAVDGIATLVSEVEVTDSVTS